VTPADFPALREVKLFRTMSPNDRAAVDGFLRPRAVRPGATLFIAGEPGDSMVIVAKGRMAIVSSVGGQDQVIAEIAAGEFVGEMACVDPAPRSATVRAVDEVVVFELTRSDFARLRRLAPGAAAALTGEIIQEVTQRLRAVDEKIERAMSGGLLSSGTIPLANPAQVSAAMGGARGGPPKAAPQRPARPAAPAEEPSIWQRFVTKVRGGG
jgi:CRP-like cAMP-binding protein